MDRLHHRLLLLLINLFIPANNPEIIWLYDNGGAVSFYELFNVNIILSANTISISSVASNSIMSAYKHQEGSSEGTLEEDKRVAYWFIPAPSNIIRRMFPEI